jgi:hypothetical protein
MSLKFFESFVDEVSNVFAGFLSVIDFVTYVLCIKQCIFGSQISEKIKRSLSQARQNFLTIASNENI